VGIGERLNGELRRAAWELADALWPPRCWLCGASAFNAVACELHDLAPKPSGPRCLRCAGSLPSMIPDGQLCGACRRRAPGWSRLVALGDYRAQPALRDWILAFKHGGRRDLARPLGWALAECAARAGVLARDDLLVPVPLHPLRRLERGYNQADLLAFELACCAHLESARLLVRLRDTPVQGEAGAVSRRSNVQAAFAARRAAARRLAGRRAWLVDDVVTTGATAAACARVLRSAGAREVGVLTVARVPSPSSGRPDEYPVRP
jgi:ComF family protein